METGSSDPKPLVGIIMGSISDLETMKETAKILAEFEIPHELRVVSAHRTPDLMVEYATTAAERGLDVEHAVGAAACFLDREYAGG